MGRVRGTAQYGSAHFEHHLMPDVPYYQPGWAHHELFTCGFPFGPENPAGPGDFCFFARRLAERR